MNIEKVEKGGIEVAIVKSDTVIITDTSSALDLMATVRYETGIDRIAMYKDSIIEDFFKLSTRLAGEILQKFINYNVKFAIIGDFSKYTSKPLKDFIYESNHGRDLFFVLTEEEAVQKLTAID